MRIYFIPIALLCMPARCTSGDQSTTTTTTSSSTSTTTTLPYDYWPNFESLIFDRLGSGVSSFERDYFNLKGMCLVSQVRYDTGQCRDLGGVDWIFGVEASWFLGKKHCDSWATRHTHTKIAWLIDFMMNEMNRTLDISRDHRVGAYFIDKEFQTISPLCVKKSQPFQQLKFPIQSELKLHDNWEDPYTFLNLANKIEQEINNCPRPPNKPVIVYLFLQKVTAETFWKPGVIDFFKLMDKWRSRAIRVFLITVNYCAHNFLNKQIVHQPNQYNSLMGHMAANAYENAIDHVVPVLAEFIIRCSCRRGDKCLTEETKTSPCRFKNKGGDESCHRDVNWKILSQPDGVFCNTSGTLNCPIEKCIADCNLKGWTPWTSWQLSGEIRMKKYRRSRKRKDPKAGYSDITKKNCKIEEIQSCSGEECRPQQLKVPPPIDIRYTTTPDDDEPLITGDYVDTIPLTTASRVVSTSTAAPDFNLYGLSLTVLAAIGAGLVLILAIMCCAVCMVTSSNRRKAARFKIVFGAAKQPSSQSQYSVGGTRQKTSSWMKKLSSLSPQTSQRTKLSWIAPPGAGRSVVVGGSMSPHAGRRASVAQPKSKFGRGTYLMPSFRPGGGVSQNRQQQDRESLNSKQLSLPHKPYRTLKVKNPPRVSKTTSYKGSRFDAPNN